MKKARFYPWLIWLFGAGFFFMEYVARVFPSVTQFEIMQAFKLNAAGFGLLSAIFSLSYISLQLPVGTLVDRFGPKHLLMAMATLCSIGCFMFSSADWFIIALLGRLLIGIGGAFAFVGTLKLATLWFPSSRFGLLAGLTQALGMLGAATGEGIIAMVVEKVTWRPTLLLIGGLLLLLALCIGMFVPSTPIVINQDQKRYNLRQSLIKVLKKKQNWLNGLFAGFLYAPTGAFAELWGPAYFHRLYHINLDRAAFAVSMIFIGWAIGSPIFGWVSDRLKRRKPIMFFSALLSLLFMAMVLYLPEMPIYLLFGLLFLYGMSNVGVSIAYAVASETVPKTITGTSMAFTNMASVMIGMIFQPFIGYLLDWQWQGVISQGERIYSSHAYQLAMISLPICFIISIIFSLLVKETYCRHLD